MPCFNAVIYRQYHIIFGCGKFTGKFFSRIPKNNHNKLFLVQLSIQLTIYFVDSTTIWHSIFKHKLDFRLTNINTYANR